MVIDADVRAPEPPPVLVRAFLDASLEAVRFLSDHPGFASTITVEQFAEGRIIGVAPDVVTGLFWARRRFSTARLAGEMTYGERELEMNLIVGPVPMPRGANGPYALWEWLAAFGAPEHVSGGGEWPATAARVRAAVAALGAAFQEHAPRIASAGPEVVQRIEAARGRRQAEWAEEHAEWRHQSTVARAADAFRAGDYAQVVALLDPIAKRLTPAELKKLEIARKRL